MNFDYFAIKIVPFGEKLKCMPDEPKEVSDAVMRRMEEREFLSK